MTTKIVFVQVTTTRSQEDLMFLQGTGKLEEVTQQLAQHAQEQLDELDELLEDDWKIVAQQSVVETRGTSLAFVLHKPTLAVELDRELDRLSMRDGHLS